MPAIDDFQYGYDASGVQTYLDTIKADSLEKAKIAVQAIDDIKAVCNEEWEGAAKDNFLKNLESDAQYVAEQFDTLYTVLEEEVNQALATMQNNDQKLIDS